MNSKTTHITPADGDVFADLGKPPARFRRGQRQNRKVHAGRAVCHDCENRQNARAAHPLNGGIGLIPRQCLYTATHAFSAV